MFDELFDELLTTMLRTLFRNVVDELFGVRFDECLSLHFGNVVIQSREYLETIRPIEARGPSHASHTKSAGFLCESFLIYPGPKIQLKITVYKLPHSWCFALIATKEPP